ncbi:MAG: preprotein translocase subunit YajC [Vicinamibacterales bacterium]
MMISAGAVFAMAAPPDGSSSWLQFIPFVLVIGIFYFVILMPMQKKQRAVQEFQQGLKAGDRVITTGGIHGLITKVGGDVVTLQIANNVKIEIARAAIGGLQGQPPVVDNTNQ